MKYKTKKTIAIDFDGVIHKYRYGWKDGSIYDEPNKEVVKGIYDLLRKGYAVYIHSTRSPWKVARWMRKQYPWFGPMAEDMCEGLPVQVIPFWKKFWNKEMTLGVSRRKIPAVIYIDDRAEKFNGNWKEIEKKL